MFDPRGDEPGGGEGQNFMTICGSVSFEGGKIQGVRVDGPNLGVPSGGAKIGRRHGGEP